jgi:hypothetical protein
MENLPDTVTSTHQTQSGLENVVCETVASPEDIFTMTDKCSQLCKTILTDTTYDQLQQFANHSQLLIQFLSQKFVEIMLVVIAMLMLCRSRKKNNFHTQAGRESDSPTCNLSSQKTGNLDLLLEQLSSNTLYTASVVFMCGSYCLGDTIFGTGLAISKLLCICAFGLTLLKCVRQFVVSFTHYKQQSGLEIALEDTELREQDDKEVIGPVLANDKPLVTFHDNTKLSQIRNGINIAELNQQFSGSSFGESTSLLKLTSNKAPKR